MLWSGCCWRIAVDLRKLEQQFGRWSVASGRPALFQGPNLCEGNLLWRWGLGVWRGRLGLVPTGGAARAWTWTARRPCIQDDPTSCKDDIKESEVLEMRLWFEFDLEPQLNNTQKWLMELGMRVSTETYQLNSCLGCDVMLHILWRLQNSSEDLQHPERNRGNDALKRIKCALKILRLPSNQTCRSTKLILIYFINIPIYFFLVKNPHFFIFIVLFCPHTPFRARASIPSLWMRGDTTSRVCGVCCLLRSNNSLTPLAPCPASAYRTTPDRRLTWMDSWHGSCPRQIRSLVQKNTTV